MHRQSYKGGGARHLRELDVLAVKLPEWLGGSYKVPRGGAGNVN